MHVVLVDPSRTVLRIVTGLLDAGAHQVRPFADAHAALEFIKSDPTVDALITSFELTSMSGLELCTETRRLASGGRPIYVILMSSNQDGQKLIEALDNGADDFIGKPPVVEELYARLRAAERVVTMQRQLVRLASTDPLTEVMNRRAFFDRAQSLCARVAAGGLLCAAMADIDHFKAINDAHGHHVGDKVIQGVVREANTLQKASVGRLGGEEFAILLEDMTLIHAVELMDQTRLRISRLNIDAGGKNVAVTCSFGVSEWEAGDTIDQLLKRADMALYKAKADGRNRVLAYEHSFMLPDYRPSVLRA